MTIFNYLLIGHLIGDFLLQTTWMAMNKSKKWMPLITHCIVYTLSVFVVTLIGGEALSIGAIVLIFSSHILLDRRTFVVWWVKHIMGSKGNDAGWLTIMADQVFHILILGAVAHFWF